MRSQITRLFILLGLLFPALASAVSVIEFYNTNLDNYFITADASEASAIDNGSAGAGWIRTGYSFNSGGSTPVCRFYGSYTPGPNSHFYTVDASECQGLKDQQFLTGDPRKLTDKSWNFESLDFVSTAPTNGTCPTSTTPVYRAYNNGFARGVDSNHRITSSLTALQEVVSRGWSNEGIVMCAPGAQVATVYLYKWSMTGVAPQLYHANTLQGFVSPKGTFTWASRSFTLTILGTETDWSSIFPENPGTPLLQLWVASKQVTADAGTETTLVDFIDAHVYVAGGS